MDLKNIDNLLKSKDRLTGLMNKGLLGHIDKNSLNSSILTLEKLRKQYDSADANGKITMLGFMDKEYKNIVSNIPNLKNKVLVNKQLAEESGDKKLLNEYDKTFKDIDVLDKNINKDKKEEVDDFLGITTNIPVVTKEKDVQKQVVVPNAQHNNVGVQPLTYQDRKLVKDPTTGKWGYESKRTGDVEGSYDNEQLAKQAIDENLKEHYGVGIKNAILNKDDAKKQELESGMKKRGLTKEQVESWLSE